MNENNVGARVLRSGHTARVDDYDAIGGPVAEMLRAAGVRSVVAAPIVVDGSVWGLVSAAMSQPNVFPADAEQRVAGFTELVATAISNAESRAQLSASRARIVAASDETRRRIERDLHDGIQQRLVTFALQLRAAEDTLPSQRQDLRASLSHLGDGLRSLLDEVREISLGLHPAILTEGGLGPALKAVARRSAVPVEVEVGAVERLPEPVEVAAYFAVSEALANTAKHGGAALATVTLVVRDGTLRLSIRDDGVGGADPGKGSGLVGLRDRVEAVGGTLRLQSPVGEGTLLTVDLPIHGSLSRDAQVAAAVVKPQPQPSKTPRRTT
jgi:signal transduction histidine kinase